ncbi:hypothetical protein [Desulfovibrio piger]
MDIRQASRGLHGTEARGTIPPAAIAEEKTPRPVPEVDGDATLKSPLEEFGPESVIKSYRDFLHARDISDDDIRDVLEYLITSGNVSWKFELFDRIPAEFRIRPSWVDDYILETIDRETTGDERLSMMRYNNLVAVCNLAASLASFKDETYRVETKEDFDRARKRVQDMPYIIQNALVNKLAVFDRTIAVATSDWAIKNFMRPRKEK